MLFSGAPCCHLFPIENPPHMAVALGAGGGPISAKICCAEFTPKPGTSASRCTVAAQYPGTAKQTRHLLVQLADLLLDPLQLFQYHLQQPTVDGVEIDNHPARHTTVLSFYVRQFPLLCDLSR
jgi:hypothetical protein